MAKFILNLFFPIMLAVTSTNLLHLYFKGAWYDPIKTVEIAEFALLFLFALSGILYFTWQVVKEY